MSEENTNQTAPEPTPIQNQSESSPIGLDNSLDEALQKAFAVKPPEELKKENIDEKPKEEVGKGPEEKIPEKKDEGSGKTTSSKLPNPDSISDVPAGKKVSPESKQGWDTLRSNYKKAHNMVEERDKEISALKASLADKGQSTTKEVEELKKEIQELNKYRAMVDIQADPEFISKFDEPIKGRKQDIKDLLTPHNVSEQVIDNIDYTDSKAISEIASIIRKERGDVDADDFLASARELRSLMNKREKASREQGEKYKEHLEVKKKESFTKAAEEEGRTLRHLEKVSKEKSIPFLNKKEAREGAGKAELDQVKSHNDLVDLMQSKVNEVLRMNTPEDKAEVAIAAIASHWLSAQNKQLEQRITGLEAELKKISNINSETEKPKSAPRKNGENLDLDSAMRAHFANL